MARLASKCESAVILDGTNLRCLHSEPWQEQTESLNRPARVLRTLTELKKKICVDKIVSSQGGNADQASYPRPVTAVRNRYVGLKQPEAAGKCHPRE